MFDYLIKLVREEKVSLFIGAGFSIKANAPSVGKLKERILSELDLQGQENHKDDSLAELTNFFVEDFCCGSRNQLISVLKEIFTFTPTCMDDHKMLATIPHFKTIFTTNYDTLLEDSYPEIECHVIRNDVDCAYLKPINIFKIHGDFTSPDSIVITSNDYDNYFKNNQNPGMWKLVQNEFLTKHILFIGYSLQDDNIIDIIQTISTTINKNQKQMFLIAPNISEQKQGQLSKMKVSYFNAYAEDFLKQLIEGIRNNITKDFKHKKVSAETYTKFCNINGFTPQVEMPVNEENKVTDFKPLPGKDLEHKINFTIPENFKPVMETMDFEKYGVFIENSPFKSRPFIKIEGENLLKCTHFVNNVVINDEFAHILIAPVAKEIKLSIRIPSRNFFEQVTGESYPLNKNKFIIKFDCHIYTTTITVEHKKATEDTRQVTMNFNFDFKETYTNNNDALLWIDFISASFGKEPFYINEFSANPFTIKINSNKDNKQLEYFKDYYRNIKNIELITGKKFSVYNACTEENHRMSKIVLAYLQKQPLTINCPDGLEFSATIGKDNDFIERTKDDPHFSIVTTDAENTEFHLNGTVFNIPYALKVFNYCEIEKIEKESDTTYSIDVKHKHNTYIIIYTDKSIGEYFPEMKQLDVH